ncbi:hypothetical protein [Prolixibacter bellariivorans]|uniref:hypothetical protein n=1 Tax=Prolixibacter bellariivorans TaxID=314319 RepID=UPI000A907EC5|nr:hypothetical protein [Prolixibacter bellariivorans]
MLDKIEQLKKEIEAMVAQSADEVEQLRIKYLSKKGEVSKLFAEFRNVPAEQKREVGQAINTCGILPRNALMFCEVVFRSKKTVQLALI